MRPPPFILDACVLYNASVRDVLLQLAHEGMFEPRWTERIHEEWIVAVVAKRPDLPRSRLDRVRALMDSAFPFALVSGHEPLIAGLRLSDADDRHVLAAAIAAGAKGIVTFNQRDFPSSVLAPLGIEAVTPDAFVLGLIERDRDGVRAALETVRDRLRSPAYAPEDFLLRLSGRGLPRSVRALSGDDAGPA